MAAPDQDAGQDFSPAAPAVAADVAGPEDEAEPRECRICRGPMSDEDGPLYAPCKCDGSIRDVHSECLISWLKHSGKDECELCHHRFSFVPLYAEDAPATVSASRIAVVCAKSLATEWVPYAGRIVCAGVLWLCVVPWVTAWLYRVWIHHRWRSSGEDGAGPHHHAGRAPLPNNVPVASLDGKVELVPVTDGDGADDASGLWNECVEGVMIAGVVMFTFLALMSFADFLRFQWDNGDLGDEHDDDLPDLVPPADLPDLVPPADHAAEAEADAVAADRADAERAFRAWDGWGDPAAAGQAAAARDRALPAAAAAGPPPEEAAAELLDEFTDGEASDDDADEEGAGWVGGMLGAVWGGRRPQYPDGNNDQHAEAMAPAQAGAPAAQAAALPEAVPPAPLANDVVHGQAADALFAGGAVEVAAEPPAAAAEIAAEPPAAAAAAAPAAPAVPVAPAAAPAAPADTDSDASSDSDSDDEGINHPVDDDDGFDADLGDLDLAPPMLGAGGLDDDGGPPPLDDMMEVELHVAIDELLGIRGPVSVLVRNVMWFVAFNAVYLGVFAFVPFSIGTQFCAVASTHPHFAGLAERAARLLPERAWQLYGDLYASSAENNSTLRFPDMLMITLGYLLIGAMVFALQGLAGFTTSRSTQYLPRRLLPLAGGLLANRAGMALDWSAALAKVGILLFLKMLVPPLLLGLALDASTMGILGGSLEERASFCGKNLVGSLGLHWVLGISFMLLITISVLQLREVVHPKLLASAIRPQEPHPDLVTSLLQDSAAEHARRIVLSMLIYVAILAGLVHAPAAAAAAVMARRGVAHVELSFLYRVPHLQIPFELALYHLTMLGFLDRHKNGIGQVQHWWLKRACGPLGLTRYVLPTRHGAGGGAPGGGPRRVELLQRPPAEWHRHVVPPPQGRWAYGAEPKTRLERSLARRRKPSFVTLRLAALALLSWGAAVLGVALGVAAPLAVGRAMSRVARLPPAYAHDPLNLAAGAAVLYAVRAPLGRAFDTLTRPGLLARKAAGAWKARRWPAAPPGGRAREGACLQAAVSFAVSWFALVPLATGLLVHLCVSAVLETSAAAAVRVVAAGAAKTVAKDWALGLGLLHLWAGLNACGWLDGLTPYFFTASWAFPRGAEEEDDSDSDDGGSDDGGNGGDRSEGDNEVFAGEPPRADAARDTRGVAGLRRRGVAVVADVEGGVNEDVDEDVDEGEDEAPSFDELPPCEWGPSVVTVVASVEALCREWAWPAELPEALWELLQPLLSATCPPVLIALAAFIMSGVYAYVKDRPESSLYPIVVETYIGQFFGRQLMGWLGEMGVDPDAPVLLPSGEALSLPFLTAVNIARSAAGSCVVCTALDLLRNPFARLLWMLHDHVRDETYLVGMALQDHPVHVGGAEE